MINPGNRNSTSEESAIAFSTFGWSECDDQEPWSESTHQVMIGKVKWSTQLGSEIPVLVDLPPKDFPNPFGK